MTREAWGRIVACGIVQLISQAGFVDTFEY